MMISGVKKICIAILLLMFLSIGSETGLAFEPNEPRWATNVRSKITEIETLYFRLQEHQARYDAIQYSGPENPNSIEYILKSIVHLEQQDPNIIQEYREIRKQVYRCIFDLWKLSGHCLFPDYKEDVLVLNVPVILSRYKCFIEANCQEEQEIVVMRGIESNIKVIDSEYLLPAIFVLTKYIIFRAPPRAEYDDLRHTKDVSTECKEAARRVMELWLQKHQSQLTWDQYSCAFVTNQQTVFDLPEEVRILARRASTGLRLHKINGEKILVPIRGYDQFLRLLQEQKEK
jgi:hypothetical protein